MPGTTTAKWTQSNEIKQFHDAQMETRARIADAQKATSEAAKPGAATPATAGTPGISEIAPGIFGLEGTSGSDQFEIVRSEGRVRMSVQSPGREAIKRDVAEADYRGAFVSTGAGGNDVVRNNADNVTINAKDSTRASVENAGNNVLVLDSKGADGIINRGGRNFRATVGKGDGLSSSGDETSLKFREAGAAATVVGNKANVAGMDNGGRDFAAVATDAATAGNLKYDAGTDRGAVVSLEDVGLKDSDANMRARWEDVVARPDAYQKSIPDLNGARGRAIGDLQGALGFTAKDTGDGRDQDQIFGPITGGALKEMTGALSANYAAPKPDPAKRRAFSLDEIVKANDTAPVVAPTTEKPNTSVPVIPPPVVVTPSGVVPATTEKPNTSVPAIPPPQVITAPKVDEAALQKERVNAKVVTLKAGINRDNGYFAQAETTAELNRAMIGGDDRVFADAVRQMEQKTGRTWEQMLKGPTERADEDWKHFAMQLPAARLNWNNPTNPANVKTYMSQLKGAAGTFNDDERTIADVFAKASHSEIRALHRQMDLNAYLGSVFTSGNPLRGALKERLDQAMKASE